MAISQHDALSIALRILNDLKEDGRCDLDGHGNCTTHQWTGNDGCPQFRIKLLMKNLGAGGANPVYTKPTLLAMLNGCTADRQEVHVRTAVNGYIHRGRLGHNPDSSNPSRAFYADLAHGDRVEHLSPDDILEADVCARSLSGVPLDPTHDPA